MQKTHDIAEGTDYPDVDHTSLPSLPMKPLVVPSPSSALPVLIAALLAALFLIGCSEPKRADAPPEEPATEPLVLRETSPSSKPTASDERAATTSKDEPKAETELSPVPVVEPLPPQKAAAGSMVWAITRISITNDNGVFSVPPGAALRVVRETANGYVVSHRDQEVEVHEAQVSTSPASAVAEVQADASARAANAAWHRAQEQAALQQRENANQAAQSAAVERRIRELQARFDALTREEAVLSANLEQLRVDQARNSMARVYGRVSAKSTNSQYEGTWRARLAVVQVEKDRLHLELLRSNQ